MAVPKSVLEYSDITTVHGLKQLFTVNWIRRVIWIVVLFTCMALFCLQIYKKIKLWKTEPIVTNIEVEYPPAIHFPAVMICNDNLFKITYTQHNLYYMISEIYSVGGTGKLNLDVNFNKYHQDFSRVVMNNSFEFLSMASSHLEDMLVLCIKPNGETCSAADFDVVATDFGICYTFNQNIQDPIFIQSEGFSNGLYLVINIEAYERMPGSVNTLGLKVALYNQTSYPIAKLEGIDVPPGSQTNIGMRMQYRNKIHIDNGGNCITWMPLEYIDSDIYSINRCKINMMIKRVLEKCNCVPFYTPKKNILLRHSFAFAATMPNRRRCNVREHFTCVVYANRIPVEASTCRDNCSAAVYNTFLSYTKLPPNFITNTAGHRVADEIFGKYLKANEVRQRVQLDQMEKNQRLIDAMRHADAHLRATNFTPVIENFLPTFERLKLEVECFGNMSSNFENSLLRNGVWQALDDPYHFLLHDEKILSVLHPEISIGDLIVNQENLSRWHREEIHDYREELRIALKSLDAMLELFRGWKYEIELPTTMQAYVDVYNLIDKYENETITKLKWANDGTQLSRMIGQFTGTFLNSIEANVVTNVRHRIHSENMNNASASLKNLLLENTLLQRLLEELIFSNYKNETCVEDYAPLSDFYYQKHKNSDFYPNLVDSPDRIMGLCPIIPPFDIVSFVIQLDDCIFGPLYNKSQELSEVVNNLSSILSEPFDQLQKELVAYDWFLGKGTTIFRDNILSLNIYFQDLSIEKITQEPAYDIWSFLCDAGGTMGLWLGASLVTLFEMFDFFVLKPLVRPPVRNKVNAVENGTITRETTRL